MDIWIDEKNYQTKVIDLRCGRPPHFSVLDILIGSEKITIKFEDANEIHLFGLKIANQALAAEKRPLRATESDDLEAGKGLIPPNSSQNPKEVA